MTKAKVSDMQRRRIVLRDGRYLIFYTFDNAHGAPRNNSQPAPDIAQSSAGEPEALESQLEGKTSV